jgi:hypothetical protein
MIADEDRIEAELFGENSEAEQRVRPELLRRRFVSKPQLHWALSLRKCDQQTGLIAETLGFRQKVNGFASNRHRICGIRTNVR